MWYNRANKGGIWMRIAVVDDAAADRRWLAGELEVLLARRGLEAPEELLEPLRSAAPGLRPRLTPYHAVGTAGGLLLTIRTDWTEIDGTRYPGLTAALAPTALGEGYTALWGGPAGKGGGHERLEGSERAGAAAAGPVGRPGCH